MPRFSAPLLGASCLLLGSAAMPLQAASGQVHEHGASRLDVVLEGQSLQMSLSGPGHNFVGFEHAAVTPDEKQAMQAAEAALKDAPRLFALPDAAGCTVTGTTVSFDDSGHHAHGEADHDRHHGHSHEGHGHDAEDGHEHGHDEHAHSDWRADYVFQCTNPDALDRIGVQVFDAFPQTESIRFQSMTPSAQNGGTLTSSERSLALSQP